MKKKFLVSTALAIVIMLALSVYGQAQTQYTLKVTNNSGMTQTIAVYQTYPKGGHPVVWLSSQVNNGGDTQFTWTVNWALGWGTVPQQIKPGIYYTPAQTIPVTPGDKSGTNKATLNYKGPWPNGTFEFINPTYDLQLRSTEMAIYANRTFPPNETTAVSVSMSGNVVLAMKAEPGLTYYFDAHPTYYLCIASSKVGTLLSSDYVSSPTKVIFGSTKSLCYTLNDEYKFQLEPTCNNIADVTLKPGDNPQQFWAQWEVSIGKFKKNTHIVLQLVDVTEIKQCDINGKWLHPFKYSKPVIDRSNKTITFDILEYPEGIQHFLVQVSAAFSQDGSPARADQLKVKSSSYTNQ